MLIKPGATMGAPAFFFPLEVFPPVGFPPEVGAVPLRVICLISFVTFFSRHYSP